MFSVWSVHAIPNPSHSSSCHCHCLSPTLIYCHANVRYNASAPPSSRKSGVAPNNCFVANFTSPATVTPRGPHNLHEVNLCSLTSIMGDANRNRSLSNPPYYHKSGSIHTHRRGSYSADMLASTINEINDGDGDKQMALNGTSAASIPAYNHSHAPQQPHPFAAIPPQQQSHIPVAQPQAPAPAVFGIPAPHNHHPLYARSLSHVPPSSAPQQQAPLHRSALSSMDLSLPSAFSTHSHNSHRVSFDKNSLFMASSHHTSHTAAAGDLLSMSRSTPDTSTSNAKEQKKRAASYSGQSDMMMQGINVNQFGAQQQQQPVFSMSVVAPTPGSHQFMHSNQVSAGSLFSTFSTNASTAGSVYSQPQQQQQEYDGSYQYHINKRTCRRSSSFDMMDDRC